MVPNDYTLNPMRLYLVRHGEAASDKEDSRRPLSAAGRRQVVDLARKAKEAGAAPARILHSGKLRAQQTAEVLGEALEPVEVREIAGLLPEDDPEPAAELARESDEEVMLVGHLPFMGVLSGLLLGTHLEVSFSTATMACFERGSGWKLIWKITGGSR